MLKKLILILTATTILFSLQISSQASEIETTENYLRAAINTDSAIELQKSNIFDASKSFIPDPTKDISYKWDFGDGNKNEGIEALHSYQQPGNYKVTLMISDGGNSSETSMDVFVYRKLVILITDRTEDEDRINIIQDFAEKKGVYMKIIQSYGSSTDFISEEILSKKLAEETEFIEKTKQILIWTKENAGLNALSRFIQQKSNELLNTKNIIIFESEISSSQNRIQRQFNFINPKSIIITKEAAIDALIESNTMEDFLKTLKERGSSYKIIDAKSGQFRAWNFMSYFVNFLINSGIPDNTIALLLLLPVIATVIAFMRQVIGLTTFGIYTPSIITLSFLVIGMHAGLLTLLSAILVGTISRPLLKKMRMLFIPKMAIVITLVSLSLFLILIASIYLNLFDPRFLSIAIFPMLILSTLVEKFVSSKGEKGYASATIVMGETLLVAIIAYLVAGGEVNLGITSFKFELIKQWMLSYPELIFILIIANIFLGRWSGLRVLEHVRFREVLRHIEE